jgi:DtxR family transcriptional regulator, Mn-dependent transcriptional regulator
VNQHHIDLIDTTEMFLRTIWELEEEGVTPLRARIAERLGQSGPTVSQTVARMERDGLVHVESDRHLALTEAGRRRAVAVMRKHRLAERLLSDVIGLEWEQLHIEACRWEHVMSEAVERRILTLLAEPLVCPHGNPIPGLDELGVTPDADRVAPDGHIADRPPAGDRLPTLAASVGGDEVTVRIERISELLQPDAEVMRQLNACGLTPGVSVAVSRKPDGLHVVGAGDAEPVRDEIAEHIFVSMPA